MKKKSKLPTEGQFAAVWEYGGKVIGSWFEWRDGKLFEYQEYDEKGEYQDDLNNEVTPYFEQFNPIFFVR